MGTHPIFESDFDCLTEWLRKYTEPTTPLCASTWPPTDRTTCPRTPDSSTPTICENAGSTTPTSTDAPMSANTLEKILKFAAISVTSKTQLSGSPSTKPGRPSPRPLKSEKPSTANFSPPKNLSKFLLTLPCPSVISLLGFVSKLLNFMKYDNCSTLENPNFYLFWRFLVAYSPLN